MDWEVMSEAVVDYLGFFLPPLIFLVSAVGTFFSAYSTRLWILFLALGLIMLLLILIGVIGDYTSRVELKKRGVEW